MATITGENLKTAFFNVIKGIVPRYQPTKRFAECQLDLSGRAQRQEDRQFGYTWDAEVESILCLGARQMQLTLYIAYTKNVITQDINQVKQTLLEWHPDGVILTDCGIPVELFGEQGESAKLVRLPIFIDYRPPELEA